MARRLRFIPDGGALVEVTCRTIQGRFLLRPTAELRSIVIGVLGRANKLYPVKIHAFVFLSNHYHLLLSVEDAQRLARFMNHVNSNLAREAGRLNDWKERIWSRRYQAIVISREEAAQVNRFWYLLSHGCKEGLVSRPQDWPGANCARALISGASLEGFWFDRTLEYAARSRGEKFRRMKYAFREIVRLDPLPCWSHWSDSKYREQMGELIHQIETGCSERHARNGTQPLGIDRVMASHPHDRPRSLKRATAPLFHAAAKSVWWELVEAYRLFMACFREAAERLRQGQLRVRFPEGSFPPRLPFVEWAMEVAPE